ncbi:MAG: hypothetical protein A3F74_15310 [Betaproteobacteria bacterium RIFCSPLOWO2_12_FULL_62_58]|nr:MAG: hypothetical protein A3F74_15310 [Betaproteobacteria bacterium RIFCSPLOWO2_12_FULL_62_58]
MANSKLEGPKLKVERAKRHIDELEREIEVYRQTKPYSITPNIDTAAPGEVINIDLPKVVPMNLSVIAGDVLHNLRSALDQLVCRLAERSGANSTNGVYFPFGRDSAEFEAAAKGKIKKLNAAAQTFIRELKPYKGGNDLLWSIHALNIMDKHRLLVPVGSLATLRGVPVGEPLYGLMLPDFNALKEGTNKILLRPTPIYDHKIEFAFDIAFGDVEPVKDQSVLATLHQLSDLVSEIISLAEKLVFC